jgi:uncharacterized OB-fold protein
VAISDRHYDNNSAYDIDERWNEELRSSLTSILDKNEEKLRRLKDVKTLIDCYKKTNEYKQQIEEQGILSFMVNEMTEELLKQVEPYYIGSIVKNIEIQTGIKREQSTVEINSKIDFASLKRYVEFIVEINKIPSYSVKFTFQIDTSAHVTKLRFTNNAGKGKSIHIEKLGIKIELSLLQIEFSDLITLSSHISFNKKMKLGSKSFEIHDLSLYAKRSVRNKEGTVCPRCSTMNSPEWKYCTKCSFRL